MLFWTPVLLCLVLAAYLRWPGLDPGSFYLDDQWVAALDRIATLDVDHVIPGHGPVATTRYLATQKAVLLEWKAAVAAAVARGWSREETIRRVTFAERYPVDAVFHGHAHAGRDGAAYDVVDRGEVGVVQQVRGFADELDPQTRVAVYEELLADPQQHVGEVVPAPRVAGGADGAVVKRVGVAVNVPAGAQGEGYAAAEEDDRAEVLVEHRDVDVGARAKPRLNALERSAPARDVRGIDGDRL